MGAVFRASFLTYLMPPDKPSTSMVLSSLFILFFFIHAQNTALIVLHAAESGSSEQVYNKDGPGYTTA